MCPERLAGLTHPYLDAGIVYEAVLAADQVIPEETGIFSNLLAPLDFRLGEVTCVERVEFAAIRADDFSCNCTAIRRDV